MQRKEEKEYEYDPKRMIQSKHAEERQTFIPRHEYLMGRRREQP